MEEKEKLKLEEKDVKKFDFTTFELNYIIKNANFNDFQLEVFKRLTDPKGRQTTIKIALETNVSTATVSRTIKQIKRKIYRLL
jgi:predicted transcriptional regulator